MNGQLYQSCDRYECHTEPVCSMCQYCEKHCTCPSESQVAEMRRERAALIAQTQQRNRREAEHKAAKAAWVENLTQGLEKSFVLDGCTSAHVAWEGSEIPHLGSEKTKYTDWVSRELDGEVFYSHYYGNAHAIYAPQTIIDKLILEFHNSYVRNYSQEEFSTNMNSYIPTYAHCIGGDVATRAIELGLVKGD